MYSSQVCSCMQTYYIASYVCLHVSYPKGAATHLGRTVWEGLGLKPYAQGVCASQAEAAAQVSYPHIPLQACLAPEIVSPLQIDLSFGDLQMVGSLIWESVICRMCSASGCTGM